MTSRVLLKGLKRGPQPREACTYDAEVSIDWPLQRGTRLGGVRSIGPEYGWLG